MTFTSAALCHAKNISKFFLIKTVNLMVFRGLISFGVGGAFLLLALTDIFGNMLTFINDPYPLLLQSVLLGFISFVLIGFGLFLLVKEAKQEKHAQAPPQQ